MPRPERLTASTFTAGHVSSQRVEAIQGVAKGPRGAWKGDLKKMNLFQLALHLNQQFREQQVKALGELQTLIQGGFEWSEVITKAWVKAKDKVTRQRLMQVCLLSDVDGHQEWSVQGAPVLGPQRAPSMCHVRFRSHGARPT